VGKKLKKVRKFDKNHGFVGFARGIFGKRKNNHRGTQSVTRYYNAFLNLHELLGSRKRKVKKDLRTKRDTLCYSVVKFFLCALGFLAPFARKTGKYLKSFLENRVFYIYNRSK
jgi:hypothetical protein